DLPDIPSIYELMKTDEDRALLRFVFGPWSFGRPVLAPPNLPKERLDLLRAAFQQTLHDPKFLEDAKRTKLEIRFLPPEQIILLLAQIYKTPPPVLQRARVIFGIGAN